ncbi:MFS transporter [Marinicauda algicola]|uniref:MFS transporter n=1 Tax=Marinicauda algicola TaxID=2029849 RepID=A0A4S2GYS9_9PROT|nr:MFS transporter [Marinicauda algicola]TGY88286.1 MFS transporter [Marinicauda algicola]
MSLPARLSRSRQARFALFYGAMYIGFGAYLPYMPVWFEGRGLSAEQIGMAAAAGMIGRLIAAPLGAIWADRAARRRDAILGFTLLTLAAFLAHIPATDPDAILLLAFLAGASVTGIIPLIDAFAMGQARTKHFEFGPPRAVGSATFVVGNLGGGALVSAFGGEAALVWIIAGCALAVLAALLLPPGRRMPESAGRPGPKARDLRLVLGAGLPLAFAASALIQGAHGFYYAFSAVAWRGQGIPAAAVGALWSTGVIAEIVFLTFVGRFFRGWSPAGLIALGGTVSVLRWCLLALAPPLALLFPLQILHAGSFAATCLGFLRYASAAVPGRLAATVQVINSALSGGIVLALATLASGYAYAAFGAGGFAVMALPAAAGALCAVALLQRRAT